MADSTEEARRSDTDAVSEITGIVTQTARILFSARGVTETLGRVVELAVETVEGCDFAGLMLIEGGVVATPVFTDPMVGEIDDIQREYGEGPCLNAVSDRIVTYADDLERERRWPRFSPRAVDAGIRSVLALPFSGDEQRGALNLYSRYPAAFGVVDRGKAVVLASLATLALFAAHTYEFEERRVENLHAALHTRELIGQAEGILMQRERITAMEAFDILRRASQHLNVKLREVARNVVETGEGPDTGPARNP